MKRINKKEFIRLAKTDVRFLAEHAFCTSLYPKQSYWSDMLLMYYKRAALVFTPRFLKWILQGEYRYDGTDHVYQRKIAPKLEVSIYMTEAEHVSLH